jgi:hypothetical protein
MKRLLIVALILGSLSNIRCGGEDCEVGPTGFALVVSAPNMADEVRSISVLLAIEDERWQQSFDLEETLADGETSLFVAVEPAPEGMFTAALLVEGYDARGRMTARGTGRFVAAPNACNRFRVTLARPRTAIDASRGGDKGKDEDDD